MKELRNNPEFQAIIPKLTDDEYSQLVDSLIDEGCRDALVVWNDVIVDGHNRYAICCDLDIDFKTVNKDFESDDEAKLWIIKNQLGRRNLSDHDRRLMIGMRYETEKTVKQKRDEKGRFAPCPEKQDTAKGRTVDRIADDLGVSRSTVEASEHYLNGFRNIQQVDPIEAEKIEQDKSKLTKTTIQELRKAEPEEVRQAIENAYEPKKREVVEVKQTTTRSIKLSDENRPRTTDEKDYEEAADVFRSLLIYVLSRPESFKNATKKSKAYKLTMDIEELCGDFIELLNYN